jgi:2-polyprenyl-3-methyl-5-hydroxy-6-metoxy-1,4-benzoquinol methylase
MSVHKRYSKFQSDQRQFFDELVTEDWDTYFSEDWDYTRRFEIKQLFQRIKPRTILDIGCGDGFRDGLMADYPFVERVDAFDYSEKSIQKAEQNYPHSKVRRFAADFNELDPEIQCDLVISFDVFEHLNKPEKYLEFSSRVCAPGGTVAICTPNRLRLDSRLKILSKKPIEMVDIMHFQEYTAKEIFAMGRCFALTPNSWFGHGLITSQQPFNGWLQRLNIKQSTQLGYLLKNISHLIIVLMTKPTLS